MSTTTIEKAVLLDETGKNLVTAIENTTSVLQDIETAIRNNNTNINVNFKGRLNNYSDLSNIENISLGDMYTISNKDIEHNINAGDNIVWTGIEWQVLTNALNIADKTNNEDLSTVAFSGDYNDLENKPTIPTELKNPYDLTIQGNGTTLGIYNGEYTKVVNITPDNIGAAPSDHNHDTKYLAIDGKAVTAGTADTAKNCTGNAATATKATLDKNGNDITTEYAKVTSLTTTNTRVTELEKKVEGVKASAIVYGMRIDGTKSDPTKMVTYIADATGMTPAKMNYSTGKFEYGSWENAFFMPRPCMLKYDGTVAYYLNPNDYTKKEDGTASDIADASFGGNAMMEWGQNGRKIWLKVVPDINDNTSATVYISDHQVDGDFHAYSFINSKNEEVDHFYTPIYNGSLDSNNKLRSLSGTTNIQSKNAQNEIDYAKANNTTTDVRWYTEVYSDIQLINFLLVLIGKSTDTQTVFGLGNISTYVSDTDNGMIKSGTMNNKGLFYGHNVSSRATGSIGVKVFGMENWWGNQWRRYAGHINDKGTQKIKLTYGTKDGSTATSYNTTGSGYITVNTLPAANAAYINKMTYSDKAGCVPKTSSGSASTFYCDALWTNNNQVNYARRGGYSGYGLRCGAFCVHLDSAPSYAGWHIGAAPSYK